MILSRVVLPEPLGPIRPSRSPEKRLKDRFWKRVLDPIDLRRDWQLKRGVMAKSDER
jgi:hypothetical protein